jgi:hypothetical protein
MATTPNPGLLLKPRRQWDGKDKLFLFKVSGMVDADYAGDKETWQSVSSYSTFLEGAPVSAKSRMQKCVTLSPTKAEFVSMMECAQDMMFIMRVLCSLELKVQLSMIIHCDNKGAVDLAKNWFTGGRTQHIASKVLFLRELKEKEFLKVEWVPSEHMVSDVFTKNLGIKNFNKCIKAFVGEDGYALMKGNDICLVLVPMMAM